MNLPDNIPVMTLSSATLFPRALMPLYIFEPRYRRMLADMLRSHRMFSVAMQKPDQTRESPCAVAGIGLIRVSVGHADGTSHLILQGLARVELGEPLQTRPYRVHAIRPLLRTNSDTLAVDALMGRLRELVEERLRATPDSVPFPLTDPIKPGAGNEGTDSDRGLSLGDVMRHLNSLTDADQLADLVTCALLSQSEQRQVILETVAVDERLRRLIKFLRSDIDGHPNSPVD